MYILVFLLKDRRETEITSLLQRNQGIQMTWMDVTGLPIPEQGGKLSFFRPLATERYGQKGKRLRKEQLQTWWG